MEETTGIVHDGEPFEPETKIAELRARFKKGNPLLLPCISCFSLFLYVCFSTTLTSGRSKVNSKCMGIRRGLNICPVHNVLSECLVVIMYVVECYMSNFLNKRNTFFRLYS